jgi:plastocyanin
MFKKHINLTRFTVILFLVVCATIVSACFSQSHINADVELKLKAIKAAQTGIEFTVPAGSKVALIFDNKDKTKHNFSIYDSSQAFIGTCYFRGDLVDPGKTITYLFTAPIDSGTYYFFCDLYPCQLNGKFIVT